MSFRSLAGGSYYDESNNTGSLGYREPGARRKKLAGYLKTANEIRQTYVQSWNRPDDGQLTRHDDDFTNVAMVSSGDEQMIIFPSYARRHTKVKPQAVPGAIQEVPGTGRDSRDTLGAGDAEFWKEQWEKYEHDKAIVDVDIRGWIFIPQKGQMSRKHRLMVALARQLVGLPGAANKTTPTASASSSRASSPSRKQEEELVSQEAAAIIRKGEEEAEIAGKGGFSEAPSTLSDTSSIYGDQLRPEMPSRRQTGLSERQGSVTSPSGSISSASGEKQSTQLVMTSAELAVANANLMTRLRPFMANPMAGATINVFFYNETMSRQKTIATDGYGHFNFRAALDFVPTHVRILASEELSVTEEVRVVETKGVSLISDVDDTVRHSAITKGAREIFRNAFIRDLGDLTVQGVKQWYTRLADMGVEIHYVSNSPWQLFPVLSNFFHVAGLPRGSFHLKQYSGMLQGIFEPVAERKKATLERLLGDFPERKFILVGDSGEADLEVYTDVVRDYPGRVLAVFIRDVTSSSNGGFFDSSGPVSGQSTPKGRQSRNESVDSLSNAKRFSRPVDIVDDDEDFKAAVAASLRDMEEETAQRRRSVFTNGPSPTKRISRSPERRPALPQRPSQMSVRSQQSSGENEIGDLIDFSDDNDATPRPMQSQFRRPSPSIPRKPPTLSSTTTSPPSNKPPLPSKPRRLRSASGRSVSNGHKMEQGHETPPPARKPSTSVEPSIRSPLHQVEQSPSKDEVGPPLPLRSKPAAYGKQTFNAIYNHLPAAPSYLTGPRLTSTRGQNTHPMLTTSPINLSLASDRGRSPAETRAMHDTTNGSGAPLPPPPPRRKPATTSQNTPSAASSAASRLSGYWSGQESGSEDVSGQQQVPAANKREELWRRRWRKAKEVMDRDGVMLRTWRVGDDVMDECLGVVQRELDMVYQEGGGGQMKARR